jgi:hypothetical protein
MAGVEDMSPPSGRARPRDRPQTILLLAAATIPLAVVLATAIEIALRAQRGLLAFFAAFEQWFFLGLLILVPLAFLRDSRWLRVALAYVVTSPGLEPVETHEVCLSASDHCQLWATVAGP